MLPERAIAPDEWEDYRSAPADFADDAPGIAPPGSQDASSKRRIKGSRSRASTAPLSLSTMVGQLLIGRDLIFGVQLYRKSGNELDCTLSAVFDPSPILE